MRFLDIFLQQPYDACLFSSEACIFILLVPWFECVLQGVGGAHKPKVCCHTQ